MVGEKIRFDVDIILKTFQKEDLEKLEQFKKAISLRKLGLSENKIASVLSVHRGRISRWFRGGKPTIVKVLEIVKTKEWLPLSTDNEKFITILDVFTWMLGDGHLGHTGNINLSGQRKDLEKIKPQIENFGLVCEIIEDVGPVKNSQKINHDTCRLIIKSGDCRLVKLSFGKMLAALGAPVGNKVKTNFSIPEWVFELKLTLKKRFLEVFLSNEATIRSLEGNDWLPQLDVRMNKMEGNANNLIDFLNQIKILLSEFGINASPAKIQKKFIDKHGKKCTVVLSIPKSIINIFNFSHNFELIFAEKKQGRLNILKVASEEKIEKHIKNVNNFNATLKLRESGLGSKRISKLLNIEQQQVEGWISRGTKPRFLNETEKLEKLINSYQLSVKYGGTANFPWIYNNSHRDYSYCGW